MRRWQQTEHPCEPIRAAAGYRPHQHDLSRPLPPALAPAKVDPLVPNPSVSQFTRRSARRASLNRADGKRLIDPG